MPKPISDAYDKYHAKKAKEKAMLKAKAKAKAKEKVAGAGGFVGDTPDRPRKKKTSTRKA